MYRTIAIIILLSLAVSVVAQETPEYYNFKDAQRRAESLCKEGKWEEAVQVYDEILSHATPDSEEFLQAMTAKGTCLKHAGKTEKAVDVFSRGIDLLTSETYSAVRFERKNPADTVTAKYELALNLVTAYEEQGDIEKAKKALREAGEFINAAAVDERLTPEERAEFQLALTNYNKKAAEFYLEQENFEDALAHYEKAMGQAGEVLNSEVIEQLPDEVKKEQIRSEYDVLQKIRYPLKMAQIYEQKGERETARRLYKEVRRAADYALTMDVYDKNMPEFREELQEIFDQVQTKLNEMEIY